jgi:hypothetical protein
VVRRVEVSKEPLVRRVVYLSQVPQDGGRQDLGLVAPGLPGEFREALLEAGRQRIFEFHGSQRGKATPGWEGRTPIFTRSCN